VNIAAREENNRLERVCFVAPDGAIDTSLIVALYSVVEPFSLKTIDGFYRVAYIPTVKPLY